jgi:hypothetical protein
MTVTKRNNNQKIHNTRSAAKKSPLDKTHRLKAVQPAIMPVGVYWSIRTIDMLNKKQPAFIINRT